MALRTHDSTRDARPAEVKGSMVRSVAAVLVDRGLRDAIAAQVSPEARALLRDPPLPTEWIDARHFNEIYEALHEKVGADELRHLNREAVDRGVSPYVRAAAESLLRVFGVSPAALLSRLERVAGTTARGVVYRYEPLDDTSGTFEIEYPALRDVPLGAFVATAGALEGIFALCGTTGTIDTPEVLPGGHHNGVRFRASWRAVRAK
jgi:hypothetical protein